MRAWGPTTGASPPPGLPANKPFVDQLPFHHSSKFTDQESGFNYYGYRYYCADWGRWLNRDPISEGGGINLYGMVGNDAVNWFDYLGLKLDIIGDEECKKKIAKALKDISSCGSERLKAMIEHLKNSKNRHTIACTKLGSRNMISPSAPDSAEQDATNGKGTGSATGWNPEGEDGEGGCKCKPNTVLVHELEHAFQKDTGQSKKQPDKSGLPPDEQDAVRAENDYRNKTGEAQRTDYDGKPVPNPNGPALPVPPNPTPKP